MLSRHHALARDGSLMTPKSAATPVPELVPIQILINKRAVSLYWRDMLNMGDVHGTRDGLIPLSNTAEVVAAVGSSVTTWNIGGRVSPNFSGMVWRRSNPRRDRRLYRDRSLARPSISSG